MEALKTKFGALIFDMDGTIVKTEHLWGEVIQKFLAEEAGIKSLSPINMAFLSSLSGISMKPACKGIKEHFNLPHTLEAITAYKTKIIKERFKQGVNFIEGFEAFSKILNDHQIPMAIGTNATPEHLEPLTESMKFKSFFGEHIYGIAHVNYTAKPNPAVFLHAAEQLGIKPEACIVFEDSLPGLQAAQAAGMKCIVINNGFNDHVSKYADATINNYHEAIAALEKILS